VVSAGSTIGPVEIAVIEFPGSEFKGEIVPVLADLAGRGIISILDLLIVSKDSNGDVLVVELTEIEGELAGRFAELEGEVMWLLSEEDVAVASAALQPGSTAAVIVWENSWARDLKQAIAGSGGRLLAHDRLDPDAVVSAMSGA
jgi:hypothetical protein